MSDDKTALAEAIRAVTDLWDEPLDEVHDVPQIVNAILASDWMRQHDAEVWATALRDAAVEWEALVQIQKPPLRGSVWLNNRAKLIEGVR